MLSLGLDGLEFSEFCRTLLRCFAKQVHAHLGRVGGHLHQRFNHHRECAKSWQVHLFGIVHREPPYDLYALAMICFQCFPGWYDKKRGRRGWWVDITATNLWGRTLNFWHFQGLEKLKFQGRLGVQIFSSCPSLPLLPQKNIFSSSKYFPSLPYLVFFSSAKNAFSFSKYFPLSLLQLSDFLLSIWVVRLSSFSLVLHYIFTSEWLRAGRRRGRHFWTRENGRMDNAGFNSYHDLF